MRIKDVTLVTSDEQFLAEQDIAEKVCTILESLKMDTYNNQYVVRVTVDTVDSTSTTVGDLNDE